MICCGADDCNSKVFAKFTIKTIDPDEQYSFHLCEKHHNIYGKTEDYEVIIEILP